jgi:AsmA family protein
MEIVLEPGMAPVVRADLVSRLLDLDELMAGGAEEREGDIADTLRAFDGEFVFHGKRVRARQLPLDELRLHARLRGSDLRLEPLEFRVGGGALRFLGGLNAEEVPLRGELKMTIERIDLHEVLPLFGIEDETGGVLAGKGEVRVTGHTFGDWIHSARGDLRLLMTGGKIDRLLIEIAGEEAAEKIMGFLLPEGEVILDVECAFIDAAAEEGVAKIHGFFFTTPNLNLLGSGEVNLRENTLDLLLDSETEEVRIEELLTPVSITGSFENPEISVLTPDLLARAALAALGAILVPGAGGAVAGAAPLLLGLADEETPCHEIVARAQVEDPGEPDEPRLEDLADEG